MKKLLEEIGHILGAIAALALMAYIIVAGLLVGLLGMVSCIIAILWPLIFFFDVTISIN